MTSWMRNHIENLYNFVSTPMAATRDAFTERLQSIRGTVSLLYNRVIDNVGWGDRLKEKKEENQKKKEKKLQNKKNRQKTKSI